MSSQALRDYVNHHLASTTALAALGVMLDAQVTAIGRGQPVPPVTAHAAQLAGNVLPHDWKAGEDGYSEEEWKMIRETRKIMGDDTIQVSPTTARVPVRIGHSEAINLEFHNPITVEQVELVERKAGLLQ
jgi:aspartate-semialdehyde dehydrogenase